MSMSEEILSCKVSTSISSLIGSITSYLLQYIKEKFPKNYFKDTYINDSLVSNKIAFKNIIKLKKPTIIITPTYNAENGAMGVLPYFFSTKYFTFKKPKKNYNGVLYDNINNIYIYSIPDRIKINYNIRIKLPTIMSGYDVVHYIKQSFDTNNSMNYLNNINLETEIPKIFVWYIAKKLNVDINTIEGRNLLNEYLQKNSYNGIHERINLSTGNPSYAYIYKTNILCNIPDDPSLEKNYNNKSVDNSTVEFQLSFELWTHSNYLMEMKDNIMKEDFPESNFTENDKLKYNLFIPTDYIKEIIDNKHLILTEKFLPDVNVEVDKLDLKLVINKELQEVIKEINNNHFNIDKLLLVKIFANKDEIDKENFSVDWNTLELSTKHPISNRTYTLIIYGNLKLLNKIDWFILKNQRNLIKTIQV